MQNGYPASNGWYFCRSAAAPIKFYFGTESNGIDTGILTEPGTAQVGYWNMVTLVRDAPTHAILYIDGLEAASGAVIVPGIESTNSLTIGTDQAGHHYLDGDIWMTQIWGEALPPTTGRGQSLLQSSPGRSLASVRFDPGPNQYPAHPTRADQHSIRAGRLCHQRPDGLAWKFYDGSGTTAADASGNGNSLPCLARHRGVRII